uniref:Uncharacterized protein n=1 Tax=Anguilla anguilla TaxID=7936 RepID=A0A0E9T3J0_ANGAN
MRAGGVKLQFLGAAVSAGFFGLLESVTQWLK